MSITELASHDTATIKAEFYYDQAASHYTIELNGTPVYHTVFTDRAFTAYAHVIALGDDTLGEMIAEYDAADDDQRHERMITLERQAGVSR
jgi:hypothetical protein